MSAPKRCFACVKLNTSRCCCWLQLSALICLSQTEENWPHEVTKPRCFSLSFKGTFSTWGGVGVLGRRIWKFGSCWCLKQLIFLFGRNTITTWQPLNSLNLHKVRQQISSLDASKFGFQENVKLHRQHRNASHINTACACGKQDNVCNMLTREIA